MMRRPWTHCCRFLLMGALLSGILSGCATSPTPRFYTLSPAENMRASREGESSPTPLNAEVTLGVGPVRIPEYLDRKQIVSRSAGNQIELSEFDLWGGTLRDETTRILAENIGRLLSSEKVYGFPWLTGVSLKYRVPVNILQFDGSLEGNVTLRAQWTLQSNGGMKVLMAKETQIIEPLQGSDYSALVAAHSRALARLSAEIAAAVAALPSIATP